MALTVSNAGASAEIDGLTPLLNNGYLRVYSGTRPATPDTALSGNTLLVELRFAATAFGAGVNGVATANPIANGTNIATDTASFYRALESDGTTPVVDGSVGTTGADININSVALQVGATFSLSSFTLTAPRT